MAWHDWPDPPDPTETYVIDGAAPSYGAYVPRAIPFRPFTEFGLTMASNGWERATGPLAEADCVLVEPPPPVSVYEARA